MTFDIWLWLKIKQRGYAGVGPCFHLPGFHFGTGFLSHRHMSIDEQVARAVMLPLSMAMFQACSVCWLPVKNEACDCKRGFGLQINLFTGTFISPAGDLA